MDNSAVALAEASYIAHRMELRGSLVLAVYAHIRVLPLHTPGGPTEDTKQLVVDASWGEAKVATYIGVPHRLRYMYIRPQQSTWHDHETKPYNIVYIVHVGRGGPSHEQPMASC